MIGAASTALSQPIDANLARQRQDQVLESLLIGCAFGEDPFISQTDASTKFTTGPLQNITIPPIQYQVVKPRMSLNASLVFPTLFIGASLLPANIASGSVAADADALRRTLVLQAVSSALELFHATQHTHIMYMFGLTGLYGRVYKATMTPNYLKALADGIPRSVCLCHQRN
eukprot:TRINITY_DN1794_c0_g1_i3.p1 TRINITY_DN1794_c0_g1~~TRINITY_DN1794_c0_g1_i3.p1  ORF type:complete len:172 (+),score=22.40 TRINITY_DN1794_c0_g1_i3:1245-1760(+)